jgi:hypothetical protein
MDKQEQTFKENNSPDFIYVFLKLPNETLKIIDLRFIKKLQTPRQGKARIENKGTPILK